MFDVTIYYVDGRRSLFDHVTGIDLISKYVHIQFTTDFNDHFYKEIAASTIAEMRVQVHE